jgi:predicted MPP superfamily phosphohydrolase
MLLGIICLGFLGCIFPFTIVAAPGFSEKGYVRISLLGDPHLPGNRPEAKRKVLQDINRWSDVDFVVAVGDICSTTGTEKEYAYARKFFSALEKPFFAVVGNHDYVFSDRAYTEHGSFLLSDPQERSRKLNRFLSTFEMRDLSYTRTLGNYHLIFLSLDSLEGKTYAEFSEKTLKWLAYELFSHRDKTVLIFTHAPLWPPQVTSANPKLVHFVSQPQAELLGLVMKNPHLRLWLSGHVHLGPLNPNGVGPANNLGKMTVINTCDIDGRSILDGTDLNLQAHNTIWSSSVFLYPDKIVVKVYDHSHQQWLEKLTREFPR